ncbi:hypothetical protein ACHAWF_001089 [Thalassiosira exigua]
MNADHRRCNNIRAKQRDHARSLGTKRPRGVRGIQTVGIGYEEYDFLRKGLVDRNKLFAVAMVLVCLPNYFMYYQWSFPDMMPSPFTKGKDPKEVSREQCHAVISTMLEAKRGVRVAPWTSKLNPFRRKVTERAMERMGGMIAMGCEWMETYGATGSRGSDDAEGDETAAVFCRASDEAAAPPGRKRRPEVDPEGTVKGHWGRPAQQGRPGCVEAHGGVGRRGRERRRRERVALSGVLPPLRGRRHVSSAGEPGTKGSQEIQDRTKGQRLTAPRSSSSRAWIRPRCVADRSGPGAEDGGELERRRRVQ